MWVGLAALANVERREHPLLIHDRHLAERQPGPVDSLVGKVSKISARTRVRAVSGLYAPIHREKACLKAGSDAVRFERRGLDQDQLRLCALARQFGENLVEHP